MNLGQVKFSFFVVFVMIGLSGCSYIDQILIFKFKVESNGSNLDAVRREFAARFVDIPLNSLYLINRYFGVENLLQNKCTLGRSSYYPANSNAEDPETDPYLIQYNLDYQFFVVCEKDGEIGIASNYGNWNSQDPEVLAKAPNNKKVFFRHDRLMQELKKSLEVKGFRVGSYLKVLRKMDNSIFSW